MHYALSNSLYHEFTFLHEPAASTCFPSHTLLVRGRGGEQELVSRKNDISFSEKSPDSVFKWALKGRRDCDMKKDALILAIDLDTTPFARKMTGLVCFLLVIALIHRRKAAPYNRGVTMKWP